MSTRFVSVVMFLHRLLKLFHVLNILNHCLPIILGIIGDFTDFFFFCSVQSGPKKIMSVSFKISNKDFLFESLGEGREHDRLVVEIF